MHVFVVSSISPLKISQQGLHCLCVKISPWRKHLHAADNFSRMLFQMHFIVGGKGLDIESMGEGFRIIPEFRILRLTFHRKSASKC